MKQYIIQKFLELKELCMQKSIPWALKQFIFVYGGFLALGFVLGTVSLLLDPISLLFWLLVWAFVIITSYFLLKALLTKSNWVRILYLCIMGLAILSNSIGMIASFSFGFFPWMSFVYVGIFGYFIFLLVDKEYRAWIQAR